MPQIIWTSVKFLKTGIVSILFLLYGTYIITKIVDTKSFIRCRHSYDIDIYTIFYILRQYLQISFSCSNSRGTIQNFVAFVIFQSLGCAGLFLTSWTTACQAPLSCTISRCWRFIYMCVCVCVCSLSSACYNKTLQAG